MSKRRLGGVAAGLGLLATAALSAGLPAAHADIAPQVHDVVGVGSDVVQNSVDFLSDSSPLGDPGYNAAGNVFRVFNFDATPDANGRGTFSDPSLASGAITGATQTGPTTGKYTGTGVLLNPSVVLRAGQSPEKRPNGGTAGITALLSDAHHAIDFVRSPNLPPVASGTTASYETTATGAPGVGPVDVIQFADDAQYIATASTTNAPAGLSLETLAAIYCKNYSPATYTGQITTWNQVSGNSAGSTNTIQPLRPQDTAGVLKPFQAALAPFTSDKCQAWNSNVVQVQQNDPTTVAGNPDAIVVFPLSRFKLLQSGYFPDPSNTAYNGSKAFPANDATGKTTVPLSASGITLQIPAGKPGAGLTGTTAAAAGSYYADLPFYIFFRDSDVTASAWQPGSTLNWVETLFYNPSYNATNPDPAGPPAPFFASAAAKTLLQNLGLIQKYQYFDHSAL